ncbi:hypothetical protein TrVE_jg11003 [Triparma verrucosa]|uniref:Terpene cyclase/mutase family member n=1 Tax=Triparma verrucosa TaxID=1606542 RepID=A0A9W7BX37_9STRA|nr:hypothetical protein TrVE_jg11003 [Triparma verrucosa]
MKPSSHPPTTYPFPHHNLKHSSSKHEGGKLITGSPLGRSTWEPIQTKTRNSITRTLGLINGAQNLSTTLYIHNSTAPPSPTSTHNPSLFTFTPHLNPNASDCVYKLQKLKEYLDSPPPLTIPPSYEKLTTKLGSATLPSLTVPCTTPLESLFKGTLFYNMFQDSSGLWYGDYGGPLFLNCGLIICWYIFKEEDILGEDEIIMLKHYLKVHKQNDGGWGTHIEGGSTMFGTVMCYVGLRLLGASRTELEDSRKFIIDNGTATCTSSWAKFYLCVLGVMKWESHNSTPIEMMLLPDWFPFGPGRMWCHSRMVYVPMAWLYCKRYVYEKADDDEIIKQLREELYGEGEYEKIDWKKARTTVAPMDNYSPVTYMMSFVMYLLSFYESMEVFKPLRKYLRERAFKRAEAYLIAEELQTNYICIGPVNKILNMIISRDDKNRFERHKERIKDYLWVAEDGLKMQGYNGSQCWDASFYAQALHESGMARVYPENVERLYSFLEGTQILSTPLSANSPAMFYEDYKERVKAFRHVSLGGWPFSTSAHGWPISDCTGEGLKAILALRPYVEEGVEAGRLTKMTDSRIFNAVNVILTLQNCDGGFATYENQRGFKWFEWLNPSEVFGDIMIDYSYVECSMASLTALSDFKVLYPDHRSDEIETALRRGKGFIKSLQRRDGSWYGSWACCFCYGTWFGVEGLVACGEGGSENVLRAMDFLKSKQCENGGWGEDFRSCYNKSYSPTGAERYGDSQGACVINTAWALLALIKGGEGDSDSVERGIQYLMKRQLSTGDWPQEGISGVFNRSCGITYTSYRNVFPIWALGRFRQWKERDTTNTLRFSTNLS